MIREIFDLISLGAEIVALALAAYLAWQEKWGPATFYLVWVVIAMLERSRAKS